MIYYKVFTDCDTAWYIMGDENHTYSYFFQNILGHYIYEIKKTSTGIGLFLDANEIRHKDVKQISKKQFFTELDKYLSDAVDFLNDEIGLVWEELEEEVI